MQRAATTSEGWEIAASPSRWAVQYAPTTRVRAAVPLVKLAVKHLASLHLSRVYQELRERAPQHCRRGGKWAREKFVMAVQGEFPRARGAGVPKGTILCLGRVLDAHDEQDDAEGGRRDWEEDPLGFDTNPMLLRAMCMAFE